MEIKNENNFLCEKCLTIPLLGIEIKNDCDNISDLINVKSFCIYNHKENKLKNISLKKITMENNYINYTELKCENCKEDLINSFCLDCKKNLCDNCIKSHKSHEIFYNNKYLIERDEIEIIKNNFNKSKDILNKNYAFIENNINNFKEQLNRLENIYKEIIIINEKLINIEQFVINKI